MVSALASAGNWTSSFLRITDIPVLKLGSIAAMHDDHLETIDQYRQTIVISIGTSGTECLPLTCARGRAEVRDGRTVSLPGREVRSLRLRRIQHPSQSIHRTP